VLFAFPMRSVDQVSVVLRGGGRAGELMRSVDWTKTALGPVAGWPSALKTTVGIVLHSRHPMFLWWGPELIQFYNDAYTPSFGQGKHPKAMGQPGRECWAEIWPLIWPQIDDVMARGKPNWNEDALVPILRNGRLEEVYWTYGYSPVFNEDGSVGGTLVVCTETTPRVLATRRLRVLGDLAETMTLASNAASVDRLAAQALGRATEDVPFALVCRRSRSDDQLRPTETIGVSGADATTLVAAVERLLGDAPVATHSDGGPRALPGPGLVAGTWPEPVSELFIEDLRDAAGQVRGKLVVGLSARLEFDAAYREFLRQIAERIGLSDARVEAFRVRALAESERNSLLLQAPVATAIVTGPEHVYRLANAAYLRMVGKTEIVGQTFLDAFPEIRGTPLPDILDQVYRTGQPFEAEEYLVRLSGPSGALSDTFFKFTLDPLRDASGDVYGMIAMAIDTTEQARARRLLEKTSSERETLLTELEAANRAKDEFLALLGHELRNPLSPITTALQLMRLRNRGEASHEQEVIERQVAHLTRLVDDLLDVSRITRGKVELKQEIVEIADVLARAAEIASYLFEQRNHKLSIDASREGLALRGDPVRLAQVVANLLTNAARYTPVGGTIALGAWREGGQIVISVTDNGSGISADMLTRIFDPFVQGKRTPDRAEGGLGLGLALVKNLVSLHGGEVAAHSDGPGRGSTFSIRLPALPATRASENATPKPAPVALPVTGKRVLVVDDNVDAADLLTIMLHAVGHHVTTAHDPLEALALVASAIPEVAVLDIGLPAMDGYELGARIKSQAPGCRLIALTGYGQREDRARSAATGFDVHLVKPVEIDALLAAIVG